MKEEKLSLNFDNQKTEQKNWDDKRYFSLSYYLKHQFGQKIYKLALNGGMTCPNRDGSVDTRGCIFCSEGGSGDFASPSHLTITEQIEQSKLRLNPQNFSSSKPGQANKYTGSKYIAYFQAYTNTYAPIPYLRKIFIEAISHPDIVALSIATRPDCLGEDVLALLDEINQIKPVWVELGLQTIHEKTALFIRRGYPLDCFDYAVHNLHRIHIETIVHVIIGLPGETKSDLFQTIHHISNLPIQGVKLQLLHILKDTDLADCFDAQCILTKEEYVELVIECIERLPQNIVIHRITGDGPKKTLLAPLWSGDKKNVLNTILREMKEQDTWQGKFYK